MPDPGPPLTSSLRPYQPSASLASRSMTVSGKPIAAPTWRIAMRGRNVTTLATMPVRSAPYLS